MRVVSSKMVLLLTFCCLKSQQVFNVGSIYRQTMTDMDSKRGTTQCMLYLPRWSVSLTAFLVCLAPSCRLAGLSWLLVSFKVHVEFSGRLGSCHSHLALAE